MNNPLLFTEGKAIFIERIIYIDFAEANVLQENRRVKVHLADHTMLVVTDLQAIDILVNAFVPKPLQGNYSPSVKLVENSIIKRN